MAEMEEALRSCMERLVVVREEREQIIVEAANEISAEKKRVRELQHKLEDANKKAAKLAAENRSLCKAMDAKEAVTRELRESAAAAGGKLADAMARLESSQKQAGSLQYEVRMLQKELEVRGQEREYDLKSVDAARRQQAEQLKRIAELEAECQRLRAMVRKRLPGPAAIAKMRDEVEQQQQQTPTTASPRRPRPATPSSTRPVVAPFSPRKPSPRSSVSDAEGHAYKLRAVEDENRALKQALAKRESELQFVQMRYADEACKLTVVQRQLNELTEENKQLSDANCQSQSWASALISELEQLRSGNDNGASVVASSEMDLLDDFAEIEKLEMASGDRRPKNVEHTSSKKADEGSVTQEQNGNGVDVSVSNGHPKRVKDIWELVVHKHEASGESIEAIIEQISRALEQTAIPNKTDDPDVPNDGSEVEKIVRHLAEEITSMIHTSAEDNVARSGALLHNKSELFRRLEHLVQVCHDLLQGKCILEKFIDEVCLILKYIVSQYFADQDQTDTVNSNTNFFDEVKSSSTVTTDGPHDIQSAKTAAALAVQTEAQEEPVPPSVENQIMANHLLKFDTELMQVTQAQDDNILPGGKSAYCEKESDAEASVEHWAVQEESQLAANSDILAAADKLAEFQETITILSKQLQALKTPTSSGPPDSSICNPMPSSASSGYKKPQSLASILAEEFANAEASMSPTTPKQVQSKKDEDEVNATPTRSTAQQEHSADVGDKDSAQIIVVHPVFAAEPRQQDDASADPKRKKKRGQSLLGRIMFRKRVEG